MKKALVGICVLLLVVQHSTASIFVENFPGFDRLIKESDVICVVQIYYQAQPAPSIGMPDLFCVDILKVLKGAEIQRKDGPTSIIGLRYVPLVGDQCGFTSYTRHLVFLKRIPEAGLPERVVGLKDEGSTKLERLVALHGKIVAEFCRATPYENAQTQGTHWEIPREFDLNKLSGFSIKDALRILLKASVDSKKRNAALFEKRVKEVLEMK